MIISNYANRVLPRFNGGFPRAIPLLLIKHAVDEAQNNIQAPRELVFVAAVTAISVVVQGLVDVRKPTGQCVPVSMNTVTLADSGERKTTVLDYFVEGIQEYQKKKKQEYLRSMKRWKVDTGIWEKLNRSYLRKIERLSVAGECIDEEKLRLLQHEHDKPNKPRLFKLLYEDATPEALYFGMYQDLPTAGLISSEGGGVLNGRVMNELFKQNIIWSGGSIDCARKTGESYTLDDGRLTTAIMVQIKVFQDYLNRSGERSRSSGLLSRFLFCIPRSTQGTRFIDNGTVSWEYRDKFSQRIVELLELNSLLLSTPKYVRKVIGFSPEASELWLDVANAIEAEIREGGRFEGLGDHASKLADNIARASALFHVFEGFEGDISVKTLEFAVDFCLWCSDDFNYLFAVPKPDPVEVADAAELDEWMWRCRDKGVVWMEKNYIRQYCPNKLREKGRLDRALGELYLQGKISFYFEGKKEFVDLQVRS
jgi:hypothetical protein